MKTKATIEKVTPEFLEVKTVRELLNIAVVAEKYNNSEEGKKYGGLPSDSFCQKLYYEAESNRKTFHIPLPMAKENVEMLALKNAKVRHTEPVKDDFERMLDFQQQFGAWEFMVDESKESFIDGYNTRAASHPYSEEFVIGFHAFAKEREYQQEAGEENYVTTEELLQLYTNSLFPYQVGQEITIEVDELGNTVKIIKS